MAIPALKNERIDLRTNDEEKKLLERAAELKHLSLSSYIITTSLKQAKIDLDEEEVLLLSAKDRNLILAALENPPKQTEALKRLFH